MKWKLFTIAIGLLFAFVSCFEDEGNYDYKSLEGPIWDYAYSTKPTYIYVYEGDSTVVKVAMHFPDDVDSSRFSYEWRTADGRLFCTERDLRMSTDTLFARLGISNYTELSGNGTFAVVDTVNNYKFLVRTFFSSYGPTRPGDWVMLSEKDGKSKINVVTRRSKTIDGVRHYIYNLKDGPTIDGIPHSLYGNMDKGIFSAQGIYCKTIITSSGVYVMNNYNMQIASDLSQEFSGVTPDNFKPVRALHRGTGSFLFMEDGRIYQRVQSDNYLGGKFSSESYYLDEKGYDVTYVGTTRTAGAGKFAPAWDAKNRRVLLIRMGKPYDIVPVSYNENYKDDYEVPLWEMPEGTEVLYMYAKHNTKYAYLQNTYCMIYNDADGNTWMADFLVDGNGLMDKDHDSREPFPAGNLKKGTKFLTTTVYNNTYGPHGAVLHYFIFYSDGGNTIKYVNRENNSYGDYFTFNSATDVTLNNSTEKFSDNEEIAAFLYYASGIEYNMMWVALKSGKCGYVNFSNVLLNPKIESGSWFDVGAQIVDISQLSYYTYMDWPGK